MTIEIIAAITACVSFVTALIALSTIKRASIIAKYLDRAVLEIRDELVRLSESASGTLKITNLELDKLDDLIDTTMSATEVLNTTSKGALRTINAPIRRLRAISVGSKAAISVFRRKRER
ncbi:MAG: hypothetical protein M0019_05220 [Actinomycetota bacterium]|nr:hypothetical protein [Actinomycetota bacterium]